MGSVKKVSKIKINNTMNYSKHPTWELRNIKKALDSNMAHFFNTKEDEKRLKEVKKELRKRSD